MKIAIVGMGPSWNTILDHQDEYDEIWTINYYYEMKGLNPDRVYDVHDLYFYRDSMDRVEKHVTHWEEHLCKPKDFRFFAPLPYPEVPDLEVYPMDQVIPLLKDFHRMRDGGGEYIKLWTSSFDYLMSAACAELEPGDEVYLYGWSMGWSSKRNETEYQYQLPGLAFWTGYALGKGLHVYVDPKSPIFKARMYTYEGASVITRQSLETFKGAFDLQLQQAQAEFHTIQGKFNEFMEEKYNKATNMSKEYMKDELIQKRNAMNTALEKVIRAETAANVIQHLLDNVDMAEMDTEIETEMIKVVDGEVAKALHGKWEKKA